MRILAWREYLAIRALTRMHAERTSPVAVARSSSTAVLAAVKPSVESALRAADAVLAAASARTRKSVANVSEESAGSILTHPRAAPRRIDAALQNDAQLVHALLASESVMWARDVDFKDSGGTRAPLARERVSGRLDAIGETLRRAVDERDIIFLCIERALCYASLLVSAIERRSYREALAVLRTLRDNESLFVAPSGTSQHYVDACCARSEQFSQLCMALYNVVATRIARK